MKQIILVFFAFIILTGSSSLKPKVLIIGDSISLGYTPIVKELLKEEAIVIHNEGNAEYTGFGLLKIDEWIGNEKWDVIQFNWGLWDLYGWPYKDTLRTPEIYANNLEILIGKLEKTGAKLIWATTTPVCPGPEVKALTVINSKTEKTFRKAAFRVMKKHHIEVNDLYKAIKPKREQYALGDNNVHFTAEGYHYLAKQVAAKIKQNLK